MWRFGSPVVDGDKLALLGEPHLRCGVEGALLCAAVLLIKIISADNSFSIYFRFICKFGL